MRHLGSRLRFLLLLFAVFASGCAAKSAKQAEETSWKYSAALSQGELGDLRPLYIAIEPVEDDREFYEKGKTAFVLSTIPLVPNQTYEVQHNTKQPEDTFSPTSPMRNIQLKRYGKKFLVLVYFQPQISSHNFRTTMIST